VSTASSPWAVRACGRAELGLAEIFRSHGQGYRNTHRLTAVQHKVLNAIERCRTPALGGHLERCDRCNAVRAVYHSCGNRHCPKCQTLAKERWLEARHAELLPLEYFHVVFTLPHELNRLAQYRPRVIYSLLFQVAADTLQTFARDPKHLGGDLGITAILHTWGQNLCQHVHLHCVVTGGALAPDQSCWIPARPGFLFSVRALSKVFRGKYIEGLERAFSRGDLPAEEPITQLLAQLRSQSWVVYAKPPFAGPEAVLAYLGRYTHRIAIANHRILDLRDGLVSFRWRDYADANRQKIMTLSVAEFIRRFLLHVLPTGFMRIRHFGLLANPHRKRKLARCRQLLAQSEAPPHRPRESAQEIMKRLTGIDLYACPLCHHGRMRPFQRLPADPFLLNDIELLDTS
jgi:hypothetical protein